MATATTETAITTATTETTKAAVTKMRKSVFTKVDQLKSGTGGHTLTVKVVSSKTVLQNGRLVLQHLRHTRIAECLVGDETRAIIFTARNDQGICLYLKYVSLLFL